MHDITHLKSLMTSCGYNSVALEPWFYSQIRYLSDHFFDDTSPRVAIPQSALVEIHVALFEGRPESWDALKTRLATEVDLAEVGSELDRKIAALWTQNRAVLLKPTEEKTICEVYTFK